MKCAALCMIGSVGTAASICPFRDVSGHHSVRNTLVSTLCATEKWLRIDVFVCPLLSVNYRNEVAFVNNLF